MRGAPGAKAAAKTNSVLRVSPRLRRYTRHGHRAPGATAKQAARLVRMSVRDERRGCVGAVSAPQPLTGWRARVKPALGMSRVSPTRSVRRAAASRAQPPRVCTPGPGVRRVGAAARGPRRGPRPAQSARAGAPCPDQCPPWWRGAVRSRVVRACVGAAVGLKGSWPRAGFVGRAWICPWACERGFVGEAGRCVGSRGSKCVRHIHQYRSGQEGTHTPACLHFNKVAFPHSSTAAPFS